MSVMDWSLKLSKGLTKPFDVIVFIRKFQFLHNFR